jgi:hypothetical protein
VLLALPIGILIALLAGFSVLMAGAAVTMLRCQRASAAPAPEPPAEAPGPAPVHTPGDFSDHDDHGDHGGGVAVRHSPPRTASLTRTISSTSPVRVVIAA